ncbi:MAG: UDP-N-acetylmuramoyl-L-alanine--D-glutamate ligase [Verrucomicrobiales bacterium]|jgi:UDP-N-acetylmuramoylalanine--D-glutamate ligase|nr:UDP-N-acetylmuramoyl-L-alanine--D-glutamate ligase [Verrucomicrobiales bacterium]MBP9222670.1 UDP-N-acetylmuramoyl-L-alanine--D-glutamate ligase [Verrucomicrobiales bacterium]HQZ28685.1 UDP-N-acetylmuramoyl-L-alanine--D-glutamate ligase [Verrucomicrobiales bacterium]
MNLNGQRVAILGAGGSGLAAAALALSRGAVVEAFDSGDTVKLGPAVAKFASLGVTLTCGDAALCPSGRYALAVISPGIDTAWPIATAFANASDALIGEIEFAYRLSDTPVIAITGTNGKTTTTSLIATMLNGCGVSAVAAGNIGLAYSEVVLSGKRYDWIVLELSSFQLETISEFAAEISIWMNFAPDHMDRYQSIADYLSAKKRLFENLAPGSLVIHKLECEFELPVEVVTFSSFREGADFGYSNGFIVHPESGRTFDFLSGTLQGKHNAENVMVALAVADRIGLPWEKVTGIIHSFVAPPHRCEKVAVFGGVTYLNDSKSTNLHSLESALIGQDEPVILIVGGKNKGLDFRELREIAGRMVREAVCIGEIAGAIAEDWEGFVICHTANDLRDAVLIAHQIAHDGEVVLFSPGTSSFDMFTGYEERGKVFRELVNAIPVA